MVWILLLLPPDELQLRDGGRLQGRLVSADEATVVFQTSEGRIVKPRAEVAAIRLDDERPPAGPPGVVLGEGLRADRWFTIRRLIPFPPDEMDSMSIAQVSADGGTILFCCSRGLFTIRADGTGMSRITDKNVEGYAAMTPDARRVVWFEGQMKGFIAGLDGSDRRELGNDVWIRWFRLSANGQRIVFVSDTTPGLYTLETDGSKPVRIVKTADLDANPGPSPWFKPGGGISDDGARIVFHFERDAWAVQGDGSRLRRLTTFNDKEDNLGRVRVSPHGDRIAIYVDNNDLRKPSRLEIRDWDGLKPPVVYAGDDLPRQGLFSGISMSFSRDARQLALSPPLTIFSTEDVASWTVMDEKLYGSDLQPFYGVHLASLTPDFRRAVADLNIGRAQLAVIDFFPREVKDIPLPGRIDIAPRAWPVDGSAPATASCLSPEAAFKHVGFGAYRKGRRLDAFYWDPVKLPETTPGLYRSEKVVLEPARKVAPGPLTLRVFTANKALSAYVVDVEGVEAR